MRARRHGIHPRRTAFFDHIPPTTAPNSRYVRAEVRRPVPTGTTADTMVALTNPIFLGRLGR